MNEIKAFQIRIPRQSWVFLKKKSISRDESMNEIIISLIEKYKKECKKKLTESDTMVS
jgi:hypothetical protein